MIHINRKTGTKYIDITSGEAKPKGKLSVISLFSGAGGFDIGLEMAGFTTEVCVEIDPDCRETLRLNRPDWRIFEKYAKQKGKGEIPRIPGDIRSIDGKELLEFAGLKKGEAALVVGGAPCQPFSNIGKKLGQEDERNGDLFLEFVRIVSETMPRAFIFENVAGITQKKHAEVIKYMKDQFSGLGYGISTTVLNSANYGVPQKRERFFMIGIQGIEEPAFPCPTHIKDKVSWLQFISDLDKTPALEPKQWKTVGQTFAALPENHKQRADHAVMNISDIVKKRMEFIKQGQNFKVLPLELRPDCWKNGKHQGHDTFGRLQSNLPSVTIRTAAYNPAKGMYIHPFENRGLSTLEMAALQDFPYEWQFKCRSREKVTLVSGGKQIGNAVPPGLGRALGLAVKKQITAQAPKSHGKPYVLLPSCQLETTYLPLAVAYHAPR